MTDISTTCYKLNLPSSVCNEIIELQDEFDTEQWGENEELAAITVYCAFKHGYSVNCATVAEEFDVKLVPLRSCLEKVISEYEISQSEYIQQIVQFSSFKKNASAI